MKGFVLGCEIKIANGMCCAGAFLLPGAADVYCREVLLSFPKGGSDQEGLGQVV